MTTKEYYEQWHRKLDNLIKAPKTATPTLPEFEVEQPKIETLTPEEVIITFRIFTSHQMKWNERIFIVYRPDQLSVFDDTCCIALAESPLPPGLYINQYMAPSILSIQHNETISTTIKWKHYKHTQAIRDFWSNLPNPFELAIVVGYNTAHPPLDPFDNRPTDYQSAWRELNQLLDWQKLAVFIFKLEEP